MGFLIAFGCLIAVFAGLHFACAIIASGLMAEIQTTPLGIEVKRNAEDRQRALMKNGAFRGGGIMGFNPLNEEVWAAIFDRLDELPEALRARARKLRLLRRLQIGVWVCGALLMAGEMLHVL